MLVLARYPGERILIGTDITIEVVDVKGDKVHLGFTAPKNVRVLREEISDSPGKGRRQDGVLPSDSVGYLQPIETAPKNGRYILLFGPSGFSTTPLRCEVGRWAPEYRPHRPWVTHSDDAFTDGGEAPTHWMELPQHQP